MEKKDLFRKVALDRLSSPEQLDSLMQVTRPTGWHALLAVCGLIALIVWWGVAGEIGARVAGQGILIPDRGVQRVVALSKGQIVDIIVEPGAMVRRGEIVARIDQPSILNEIRNAEAELDEARAQHEERKSFLAKDLEIQKRTFKLQRDALSAQRKSLESSAAMMQSHLDFLQESMKDYERLLKEKVIIAEKVEERRITINSTRERMELAQASQEDIKVKEQDLVAKENQVANDAERQLLDSQHKINGLERRIETLRERRDLDSRVVSKCSGRVIEIMAGQGDVVDVGGPIIAVEQLGGELKAVIYVKPTEGKKIKPGMDVSLGISTAEREKYGSLMGKVELVSDYPATQEGMLHVLGNQQLVDKLIESERGSPIAVTAILTPDSLTPSGYKWSSSSGPPMKIQSGTLCDGAITVSRNRPIELVIPYIKEKLGL